MIYKKKKIQKYKNKKTKKKDKNRKANNLIKTNTRKNIKNIKNQKQVANNTKPQSSHILSKLTDRLEFGVCGICCMEAKKVGCSIESFLHYSSFMHSLYSIRFRKMPEFFESPFFEPTQVKFDPIEHLYSIAEVCKSCNARILHHESISVCGCFRYCHQKCLLAQLAVKNPKRDDLVYWCTQCKKKLNTIYTMEINCKPHIEPINVLVIIVGMALLLTLSYIMMLYQQIVLILLGLSFVVFVLLCLVTIAITNSIIVREYFLETIRSTNLGIVISAFEELEKEFEEQTTQTQMAREN